ncbi:MAG: hypothetical protein K0R48_730 [Gammaproteobacteria bacterium]|nr:hypothetical protein [Gammaproteobacteria bacterium]
MKKITIGLCTVLSALLLINGCDSKQSPDQKQAATQGHRQADKMQAQRWDFKLPNVEVWKVGYKVQNNTVNNFIWIPSSQNMGTWKQNITDKFITDAAVKGQSPKGLMEQARLSSQGACEKVNWQILSESNDQIVYEADTIACGEGGKESQHMVGRIQRGHGGIYSLQYFAVQEILDGQMKQTMLDTVQNAKLVENN